ncbi:endospore germination permease [Clostridium tertium]|uniref:Spore germination protein n=1 Tax=Clostridium tertium TaxID=1559 RepID=A0A6N3DXS2_9CLOT
MNKISTKHFILFILGTSIISCKTYLSIFVDVGGRSTWLASILASFIFVCFLLFIMNTFKKTNNFDIVDIFNKSTPKFISSLFLIIFILALFLNAIEAAAVEANVLHSTLFIDTPIWYALAFFIVPSLFIFGKKIRTLLIFLIISFSIIIVNGILFFLLTQSYKDINNLLPILGDKPISNFLYSALMILGSMSSFMIVTPFLKYIDKTEHIRIHSLYAGVISSAFIILSFIGVITAFGPLRAANIFYPEFVLSQRIELAGFLEFGELFFIIQTVVGLFIKYILSTYSILLICNKFIKRKAVFIGVYTFLVFVLSNFLGVNNYMLYDISKYIQGVNLIAFIVIPFIVFIIYYFKFLPKKSK